MTDNHAAPTWRDPLSLGWQAHRGLLLLRLRWHATSTRRRDGRDQGTGELVG